MAAWGLGLVGLAGCAMYHQDLARAEEAYAAARYDHVVVWLDDLESQHPRMEPRDRVTFHFTRGMTYYRLGERTEALHHLALAREEAEAGAPMDAEQREQLDRMLEELTPVLGTHRARRTLDDGVDRRGRRDDEEERPPRDAPPQASDDERPPQADDDERPPRD